ncbi:unnamed protein product [Allacma fusca]|uniref:Uncharacterized protein n=1 Tax=Allacma fusca TaxID=39272 RepID=A0A8J2PWB2_9HEXA|nr:unnamed protein product [Allacma fusca]
MQFTGLIVLALVFVYAQSAATDYGEKSEPIKEIVPNLPEDLDTAQTFYLGYRRALYTRHGFHYHKAVRGGPFIGFGYPIGYQGVFLG